jgi:hypothetical protein
MAYRSRRERKRSPSVEKILHEHRAAGGKTRDHSAGDALVEGKEARKHMGKRARGYSEAHETTPPYGIDYRLFARGGANVPCDEDEQQEAKRGGEIEHTKSGGVKASARRKAEKEGDTMPGGRFPIRNAADLSNAEHAFGRAKGDKGAVRRWINKRAHELGKPSMGGSVGK